MGYFMAAVTAYRPVLGCLPICFRRRSYFLTTQSMTASILRLSLLPSGVSS